MARLNDYVARRHALAARYDELLANLPVTRPWQRPDSHSGLHLYVIRIDAGAEAQQRKRVFAALRESGIGVNVHYIPVHIQPYYKALGFEVGNFPVSEAYYEEAISLPMYPTLTEAEQDCVVAALREALAE